MDEEDVSWSALLQDARALALELGTQILSIHAQGAHLPGWDTLPDWFTGEDNGRTLWDGGR
jgi:hypothetical protein